MHKYGFELWPPNPDGHSYPLQLPDHVSAWAATLEEALKIASREVQPGWLLIPTSHVRSQCDPPHPGIR
jgi:hypothetical protein